MIDQLMGATVKLREDTEAIDPRGDEPGRFEAGKVGMVVGRQGPNPLVRWNDGTYGVVPVETVEAVRHQGTGRVGR